MLATLVSTSRTIVNEPRMNTTGRIVNARDSSARCDVLAKPMATRPLDSAER
jgi:hypothetical protein